MKLRQRRFGPGGKTSTLAAGAGMHSIHTVSFFERRGVCDVVEQSVFHSNFFGFQRLDIS
jgi:hypothetical protein